MKETDLFGLPVGVAYVVDLVVAATATCRHPSGSDHDQRSEEIEKVGR